ncbi:Uncharacterised protein [uncultured Comamonas sp.]|nr:Uncharacterised protein [uncultured Comamonas sp.]
MKDDVVNTQELLSALVDGELTGIELEQALAVAEDAQGQRNWQLYHLVGDVLRSPDLAHHSQRDVLTGLRARLAQEPPLQSTQETALQLAPGVLEQVQAPAAVRDQAANASVFRWKLAAGFASIAAVAAVGWQVMALQAAAPVGGAQLAQNAAPAVVAVAADDGRTVMLRDPNLDALLALHEQYANRPGLQVPADFLRNASLAHTGGPQRAP